MNATSRGVNALRIAGKLLFPWKVSAADLASNAAWWRTCVITSTIPVAAVLHHGVFWRPTCMLNPFQVSEWIGPGVGIWLLRDPSLPWAIVFAFSLDRIATFAPLVKLLAAPLFAAFLPLSIYVWDIPFTHRIVCATLHDGRFRIHGHLIQGRFLYLLGGLVYLIVLLRLRRRTTPPLEAGRSEG
jgi:hypothetical protein